MDRAFPYGRSLPKIPPQRARSRQPIHPRCLNDSVVIHTNKNSFFLKYDGNWMNGKLNGPGNMILPSHVYLGSFHENVVSSLFFHLALKKQTNNPDSQLGEIMKLMVIFTGGWLLLTTLHILVVYLWLLFISISYSQN